MQQNESPPHSKRIMIMAALGTVAVVILMLLIWQPFRRTPEPNAYNPAFSSFITQHTAGVISRHGTIRVQLSPEVSAGQPIGQEDLRKLFTLHPAVSGKNRWIDPHTVEFIPDQPLPSGTTYVASFALGRLTNTPAELNTFTFDFRVVEPSFELQLSGLISQNSSSLTHMRLSGELHFSDQEAPEAIEKMLKIGGSNARQGTLHWVHQPELRTSTFVIDSLPREAEDQPIQLVVDGQAIEAQKKENRSLTLPALGTFGVLDIRAVHDPEQYVLVQFSDPLLVAQQLQGLIELEGHPFSRFTIEGSEVKMYPAERLENQYAVTVHPGIENIADQKLEKARSAQVFFENRLPAVHIPGKGTILPGTGKLTLPFEAVNLRAVDVTIIRIYEMNVPQYLQRSYDDQSELRRVGNPVVQTTIALDEDKGLNLRRKNRFSLDIDQLIKAEPGAIYRVLIGFRQHYSIYPCGDLDPRDIEAAVEEDEGRRYYYSEAIDEEDDFWARYNNYYPSNYDWDERDNPCHASYYTNQRWASRDMLASNIGLISKKGNDGNMLVFATDLMSGLPLSGVTVDLLDYQQQVISSGTTNAEGAVRFDPVRRPFLLIASKDDERGYLKLDDGSSLPLSRFDVGGEVVQEGLKGFIYTERGVWRPGDSLYIGFILEEIAAKLPKNHPVTFELTDPQGRLFERMVETKSQNGFYTFRTATDKTSPTGNWQARISVGGATFQRTLKIETVMPNRLRIDLDFNGQKLLLASGGKPTTLRGSWLFGAPAKNLKARIETTLSSDRTAFSAYSGYVFDDPTRDFAVENQVLFEGTLDQTGQATISTNMAKDRRAPGMLRAGFTTRIFEPGGNFSIDYSSIPFSPYQRYIGLRVPPGDRMSGMLLTDQDHEVALALVDPQGKPLIGQQEVQVELYKIRWNWWWNQEAEYLGNFTQDRYNQLLQKDTVRLENGAGRWALRVAYPDWGRYLVRVVDPEGGHAAGKTVYIDWPGWAKREQLNHPTEASMLSFTADKERYAVGETVTLTVPTSAGGRGLVSIENGSRVLQTEWIDTQAGQSTYTFEVTPEMTPTVFVNITLLQPHAQTANDLPIRMYGVIPLAVEDPSTILHPVIRTSNVWKPESSARVQISERQGRSMTYTLAVVDEGLLDLTRFQTPDPHRAFYAREALGVKTWDLFDQVLGAWGGELERMLSIGGDADANRNIPPAKANRFEPVVRFLGPFTLKKGETNTHDVAVPQYVGSVRTMVVAAEGGAYGFAEKAVPVKKPLMLFATFPRALGPQERVQVPLSVFGLEKSIRKVTVELRSNSDLLRVDPKQAVQTLNFGEEGEQMVSFDVQAGTGTGVGKLTATARSGEHRATYSVEIDVRNPNPYMTRVERATLAPDATWQAPEGSPSTVEISSLPAINLQANLDRLIRLPHSGLEQVISSAFPQLFLKGLTPLTESDQQRITRNVQIGIQRARGYALPDGGFGYWPGATAASEWMTNYVGHFLLEARNKGYAVPEDLLSGWVRYQQDRARKWLPSQSNWRGGDLTQAYRLYGLALAGSAEIGAMNRLKEFAYLSDEAAWRLGAAYQLIGQEVVATQIVRNRPLSTAPYEQPGRTFGSVLRDQAMILETLSLMRLEEEANRSVMQVAAGLADGRAPDAQTTAYALLALGKYMETFGQQTKFSYTLNGKTVDVDHDTYLFRMELRDAGTQHLSVTNKSKERLHIRVIRSEQLPPGEQPEPNRGTPDWLGLTVRYTDLSGSEIDPRRLEQGTDFIADVMIKNKGMIGTFEHLALTQIFPAGWEIMHARMGGATGQMASSPATYVDVRDDRILTYFNIRQNETLHFRVRLHAAYVGRFLLPAVHAESLHDPRIGASVPGGWAEVRSLEIR